MTKVIYTDSVTNYIGHQKLRKMTIIYVQKKHGSDRIF